MENTVTDTEPTEAIEAVEEVVTSGVDDMDEQEFAEHFEEVGKEPKDDTEDATDKDVASNDLDALYTAQMDASDALLDRPVLIKVDGEVMKITNINDLKDMAERGTKVTQKFQKLAEDRRQLEAQLLELNVEPNVVTPDEIEEIAQDVLDSNYADDFKSSVSELPQEVRNEITSNPKVFRGLTQDFESGLAQQILPQVNRLMTVKGLNFIQAYVAAGQSLQSTKPTNEVHKSNMLKSEPRSNTDKPSNGKSASEIDSMDSASFDKYFNSL